VGRAAGAPPLRVTFVSARYPPDVGGTETHTREVAQRLAAAGVDVTVVCTSRAPVAERETRDGPVRVVRLPARPRSRDYYFAPMLSRAIRASAPDVVHCQGYHTLVAPLAMSTALARRIPYVVTLHSGENSSRLRRKLRPLQARLLRPLLVRAQRIVAVSRFEAELFARRLRLPATAFAIIPSGVDLPQPVSSAPPPPGDPLILSVGRIERYKGHQLLVEALPALARSHPGVQLRVVGAGSYEAQLIARAADLGVERHLDVAPVPVYDRAEMARLLYAADLVALMSDYESQGLAIQEALAVGRRALVSRDTALAELAQYPNVRSVPRDTDPETLATVIGEVLAQPPEPAPQMPTWEECAAALLELYDEVRNASAAPAGARRG
jgi:glycosyltransferase involved in cell wall biosynthesis